jgi:hypothetical protein
MINRLRVNPNKLRAQLSLPMLRLNSLERQKMESSERLRVKVTSFYSESESFSSFLSHPRSRRSVSQLKRWFLSLSGLILTRNLSLLQLSIQSFVHLPTAKSALK